MEARHPKQDDSLPVGLLAAALGLLLATTVLMALPAAVAVTSILDGQLLDRSQTWLGSSLGQAAPYLGVARLGLTLGLAVLVRPAKEDQ